MFILSEDGQLIHSFDGMTDRHPAPIHEIKQRMPDYFAREMRHASKLLNLPNESTSRPATSALPVPKGPGIRIYLTLGSNRLQHFKVPTVEAIAYAPEELSALVWSKDSRKIEAQQLKRWLDQMYPPAVMDGHGGVEAVSGTLQFQQAGATSTHRYATVSGQVSFTLDNKTKISYQGKLELVLRYPLESTQIESVWGNMTTTIPRHNPQGKVAEQVTMTVAIEPVSGK
ncbi:MAG: hypothetical protein JNJ77_10840 [Planctomycetia bacterium]|nr:hypothetical protein [Planctomycetia bacterium]